VPRVPVTKLKRKSLNQYFVKRCVGGPESSLFCQIKDVIPQKTQSKVRVKGQISKSEKITIRLNCLFFFQKSFAKRKQNGYIFTIMLQMIRLWSIFIAMFIQPMLRWRQS
jgi:hypothetical protein